MSHLPEPPPRPAIERKSIAYAEVHGTASDSRQDGQTGYVDSKYPKTSKWHVRWQTPAKMLALFGLGTLSAIGHHLFYESLNSTPVRTAHDGSPAYKTQEWISRYGLAFAFITKILLASSVAIAYKQHIWTKFRRQPYQVSTINAMYDATTDVLSFGSWEFLCRAKIATILALLTWTIPLSALVAPSTLLVTLTTQKPSRDMAVPSINFDSSLFTFSGMAGDVSPLLMRITSATASGGEILPMAAVAPNASYTMEFQGPSLKCDKAHGFMLKFIDKIHEAANSDISSNVGGDTIYFSITAYPSFPYMDYTGDGSSDASKLPKWNFSKMAEDCLRGPGSCAYAPWPNVQPSYFPLLVRLNDDSLVCSLQNTTYNVNFRSTETTQTIEQPYHFKWTQPVNFTAQDDPSGMASFTKAAQALANLLNGVIGKQTSIGGGYQDVQHINLMSQGTSIMQTALIGALNTSAEIKLSVGIPPLPQEDQALARGKSLGSLIEELSRNQTLSLFSSSRFWTEQGIKSNVTQSLYSNTWEYRKKNLWISYGLAILGASFGVLVGLVAVYQNGISHDTTFCTIMATTRNETLDDLARGSSLGGDTVSKELLKTRLMFGVLRGNAHYGDMSENSRAAFGLSTEIAPLQKGQVVN
ncbi:hypothetical protein FSARC_14015 [Fusarium sarcochroum]|uniref:Uncharacterized protein n=1 Tax=Fusarium sarcochroum TaxID=1208366 RepID=A0A8H4SWP6_9HYPO|nr:hypothetical protein FSARC_14015 [Fusarium sarcochroum]